MRAPRLILSLNLGVLVSGRSRPASLDRVERRGQVRAAASHWQAMVGGQQ